MSDPAQIHSILVQTSVDYPRAWENAHRMGHPEAWDFIILAVGRLYAADPNVRGNWRRGVIGDLSMDGISVLVDGEWRFVDVIGGAGGPNPTIGYHTPGPEDALRDAAGRYIGEAGAPTPAQIRPYRRTHVDYGDGPPAGERCPDPSRHQKPDCPNPRDHQKPPYAGDGAALPFGQQYLADLVTAGRVDSEGRPLADDGSWVWCFRVCYDHYIGGLTVQQAITKQREHPTDGWLRALGLR